MAVQRSNQAWFGVAFGANASAPKIRIPFSGGNIAPVKDTDRLAETDASRDIGVPYVTQVAAEGAPEFYVRDSLIPMFLYGAIGQLAATAGPTNFTHTIDVPATGNIPYLTLFRSIGTSGTLWEKFGNVQVGTLTIGAEAGAPLTATASIQGTSATRLTVDPTPGTGQGSALENGAVYNFNNAAVVINGNATAKVRSFEITIENNLSRLQADSVQAFDTYVGQREVSLGFDLYFEDATEYQKFYYESAAFTSQLDASGNSNIYQTTGATTFTFTLGANNEISFSLPRLAYEEFPVDPDPGGDPIVSAVRAVGMRGGTSVITATVKNQLAGTVYTT